ncbi:MAG: hypothetical protein ACP5M4_09370 [Acidobacteriaceae bacterium]
MDADLEAVVRGFEAELNGRTVEDCQRHPGGDARRWDAQQIVAHLVMTYRSTGQLLSRRLETGQPVGELETLTQRFLQWVVIGRGFFPRGVKAPEFTLPEKAGWEAKNGEELVAELRAGLAEMDGVLTECEAKFGPNAVGMHFIFGPLTARQWRRFHRVHGLHHLKQVKALFANEEPPAMPGRQ